MIQRFSNRGAIAFTHDLVMAAVSFWASFYLRLGETMFLYPSDLLYAGMAAFVAIAAMVFLAMDLYRGIWRYASTEDLVAIFKASSLVVLVFVAVMFGWTRLAALPRSVPLINWFVLMALLGGPRFLYRLYKDRRVDLRLSAEGRIRVPVLLVGSGDEAELFIRAVGRPQDANYRVVGTLSERAGRVGRVIHGVEVMGTLDDLEKVVDALSLRGDRPQRLILTHVGMGGAQVRGLLDRADALGMTLARMPSLTDFRDGIEDAAQVKPVAVEDLLGRPRTQLDRDAMAELIRGKRVLVTGAGGSIGSELVRQISDFGPAALTLVESSEYALYTIDMEIAERHPELARDPVIADVRDRDRLAAVFDAARPELVFHAAALKHVPLVEANPFEGVRTNVVGTANVAEACRASGVRTMVMISSDKAVNPTNVMGATKRLAEQVCQSFDTVGARDGATRFVVVRFGNVLGSTGSVVPLFQRQLAAGGPLTVTHPDMKRYFMTVPEAVELVLEASVLGSRDATHAGRIFVLDMGEPVRIMDLAKQMIRLAGLRPQIDVEIAITGLRPGEKLFEELFHSGEELLPTEYKGVLLAAPRVADAEEVAGAVLSLAESCRRGDRVAVVDTITRLVPEYRPSTHEKGTEPCPPPFVAP